MISNPDMPGCAVSAENAVVHAFPAEWEKKLRDLEEVQVPGFLPFIFAVLCLALLAPAENRFSEAEFLAELPFTGLNHSAESVASCQTTSSLESPSAHNVETFLPPE
jgi:hypothetical protein